MSKEQRGFIVYGDIQDVLTELDDQQTAQLFRGMVDYFVSGKDPKFTGVLKFVFIPIKQQMDRNADKYEKKCEKMRENANKRWNNANASNGMQTHANDANNKNNNKNNINNNNNNNTTTNTKTNVGGSDYDDEFNIFKLLGADGIDKIYESYPNSGGDLIQTVYEDVKAKKRNVKSPVGYVLGYAKRVGWDDSADHFDGGGMA